jgi:hypothetical protein
MAITWKRGTHRVYFVLCLVWTGYALFYPYKHRADEYGKDLEYCYGRTFTDEYYDSAGNTLSYDSTKNVTLSWDKSGKYLGEVKGKTAIASTTSAAELRSNCFKEAHEAYFPSDKNAYHVFLTDEPLYQGDKKGAYWWSWLIIPLAIVLPPAIVYGFIYGLCFGTFRLGKWLYKGFFPPKP